MDDSSSMAGSLWKEVQYTLSFFFVSAEISFLAQAKRALATLADVASQYDANGIDIHFLNYYESLTGVTVSCLLANREWLLIEHPHRMADLSMIISLDSDPKGRLLLDTASISSLVIISAAWTPLRDGRMRVITLRAGTSGP
jgi:hypothetical protein